MHQNFQQFDLQTLIDLLAEETKLYTKAFISGHLKESAEHKAIIDALVVEINNRKQGEFPANTREEFLPNEL